MVAETLSAGAKVPSGWRQGPGGMWLNGVDLRQWIITGINKYLPRTQVGKYGQAEKQGQSENRAQIPEQLTPDPDFSKAGLIVKLHSALLNEDFFLVSDEGLKAIVEAENPGTVVYLPEEIERLASLGADLRPEEVKRLHLVKNAFPGGEFISAGNAEDSIFNRKEIQPAAEL